MLISHLYESYLNRLIIPAITNQIIERPINTGTTTSNKTASSPIIISIISFTIHKILLITTPDSAFIYKRKDVGSCTICLPHVLALALPSPR